MKETSTILPANAQRTSSSPQLNQKTGSTHFLGLVEWISGNPPRRGLEAWGSPKITLQRESLVAKHTQSVIKLDGKHRSTGSLHNNLLKNETDLRLESEKNSIQFRNFAVAIAAADALVASSEFHSPILVSKGKRKLSLARMGKVFAMK